MGIFVKVKIPHPPFAPRPHFPSTPAATLSYLRRAAIEQLSRRNLFRRRLAVHSSKVGKAAHTPHWGYLLLLLEFDMNFVEFRPQTIAYHPSSTATSSEKYNVLPIFLYFGRTEKTRSVSFCQILRDALLYLGLILLSHLWNDSFNSKDNHLFICIIVECIWVRDRSLKAMYFIWE